MALEPQVEQPIVSPSKRRHNSLATDQQRTHKSVCLPKKLSISGALVEKKAIFLYKYIMSITLLNEGTLNTGSDFTHLKTIWGQSKQDLGDFAGFQKGKHKN